MGPDDDKGWDVEFFQQRVIECGVHLVQRLGRVREGCVGRWALSLSLFGPLERALPGLGACFLVGLGLARQLWLSPSLPSRAPTLGLGLRRREYGLARWDGLDVGTSSGGQSRVKDGDEHVEGAFLRDVKHKDKPVQTGIGHPLVKQSPIHHAVPRRVDQHNVCMVLVVLDLWLWSGTG